MIRKIFLFGFLLVIRQISAQDTLRVAQFAGIGAMTKFATADEALAAGDAVYIRPDNKRVKKADRANAPSKADAQAICLQTADEDSLTWIITNGRVFEWPEALAIGETYYLTDTVGHISIYPPASGPIQKIGVAVDTFTLDVNIQKPIAQPYKYYSAIVTQFSGFAPAESFAQNTLSGTPSWGYGGAGNYTLTCTGCFASDKTSIFAGPMNNWTMETPVCLSLASRIVDVDTIEFKVFRCDDNTSLDDVFNLSIEIRVYP